MKVSDVAGAQLILRSHSCFLPPVLIKKNKKQHFPEDKVANFTLESNHQQHKAKPDALQSSQALTVSESKHVNVAEGLSTEKRPPVEHPDLQDAVSGARRPGPL